MHWKSFVHWDWGNNSVIGYVLKQGICCIEFFFFLFFFFFFGDLLGWSLGKFSFWFWVCLQFFVLFLFLSYDVGFCEWLNAVEGQRKLLHDSTVWKVRVWGTLSAFKYFNFILSLTRKKGKKTEESIFCTPWCVCGVTYGHLQNYWSQLKFLIWRLFFFF